jgi:hypothetical protein
MRSFSCLAVVAATLMCSRMLAQQQAGSAEPGKLLEQLSTLPDGVLRVKTNSDGSFKSLVVKSTVEIEDVLGAEKGKRLARDEAEIKCKKYLTQWLQENCVFVDASNKTTSIITKNESAKDAAGNVVKIRNQEGKEYKTVTESAASLATAALRGLTVLSSEVTQANPPEFVFVMGLSQEGIDNSRNVARALSSQTGTKADEKRGPGSDFPQPERKSNPDADKY